MGSWIVYLSFKHTLQCHKIQSDNWFKQNKYFWCNHFKRARFKVFFNQQIILNSHVNNIIILVYVSSQHYVIAVFILSQVSRFISLIHNILWNSMTSTSFVFTELANTMKYGGGFLYNLFFIEWRHCVSQNEVWGRGCYITLFSPSDVTAFHRIYF